MSQFDVDGVATTGADDGVGSVAVDWAGRRRCDDVSNAVVIHPHWPRSRWVLSSSRGVDTVDRPQWTLWSDHSGHCGLTTMGTVEWPRSRWVLPGSRGRGNGDGAGRLEVSKDDERSGRRDESRRQDDARADGDLSKNWHQTNDIGNKSRSQLREYTHHPSHWQTNVLCRDACVSTNNNNETSRVPTWLRPSVQQPTVNYVWQWLTLVCSRPWSRPTRLSRPPGIYPPLVSTNMKT